MSDSFNKMARDFANILQNTNTNKPSPYDTQAEVRRVDGDTAWVHIPGGVDETPVQLTTSAKKGDIVQVRVSGGRAWLYGNATNPPTDDTKANEVDKKTSKAVDYIDDLYAKNITVENIDANKAYINELTSNNITAENIVASSGYIKDLTAAEITAENIIADHAEVDQLDAHYAQIDAANITDITSKNAWIDNLMVQTGLIASEGSVFYLDAIQVDAANITAGTIDVQRLIVSVPDQQDPTIIHKYMIHIDPTTQQPSYEKLDGDVIEDLTITADKIVAGAITADKITTQNIVGSGGWINLRNGTFNYVSATTGEGISWDGSNLWINGSLTISGHQNPLSTEISALQASADGSLTYDHEWVYKEGSAKTIAVFTAHVYRGGQDVTNEFQDEQFTWYYKTEDDPDEKPINTNTSNDPQNCGKTIEVSISLMGYGGEIVGKFTTVSNQRLLRNNGDILTDSENNHLLARVSSSGDEVRVRDLEYVTSLRPTDSVLIVGSESENLSTLENLSDAVDKHFVFTQATPVSVWNVTHNLNKYPSVTVVDSAGNVVIGDCNYIDTNSLTLTFFGSFAGKAYCN